MASLAIAHIINTQLNRLRKRRYRNAESIYLTAEELTHSHTMTPFEAPGKQAF